MSGWGDILGHAEELEEPERPRRGKRSPEAASQRAAKKREWQARHHPEADPASAPQPSPARYRRPAEPVAARVPVIIKPPEPVPPADPAALPAWTLYLAHRARLGARHAEVVRADIRWGAGAQRGAWAELAREFA